MNYVFNVLSERRRAGAAVMLLLLAFFFGYMLSLLVWNAAAYRKPASLPQQSPYVYGTYEATNGVKLHAMGTSPERIVLRAVETNVTETGDYGINGGFFWKGALLSIAVMNDMPLKGKPHAYGSGWSNIDVPKGTLVWDGGVGRFSVQVADAANRLQVTDRARYWAQGGISMSLGDDKRWRLQAARERMPQMDRPKLRSGVVYEHDQTVWLVVSETPCTAEQFRTAIREQIAPGRLADGVFLDGDGSAQMRSAEVELKGDTRAVYQMMAVER
ncbi:hypothetical protein [Paenibacillus sp. YYML68]|uniref:hypothetical protein n=1 Tax=Paenibacillus sp. YYML68 TaxID=2909250 RepID=UPI002491FEB8|nr:hypothetical protein [Paenibacillus sp. YYML68]